MSRARTVCRDLGPMINTKSTSCTWLLDNSAILESKLVFRCRDPDRTGWKYAKFWCYTVALSHWDSLFLLVNSPIYNFLYQSLCFDSVSLSLRNRAFSSNPRAQALSARCFLLNGRRQDSKRSLGYVREIDSKFILSTLGKDTANPLSHQVMAWSNFFNLTQALAPVNTQSTV